MSLLPAVGTISYNGVTFDANTETLSLSIRPRYDQARRANTCNEYDITLKTIITANAGAGYNTDTQLLSMRQLLLEPGGEFHYENKGVGGLTINLPAGDGARDVAWGPLPEELSWKSKGGAAAAEVIWRVKVAIPDCPDAVFQFQMMEFNYRLSFDIDKSGYTRRTYSGYLRIPQTRATVSTRTLTDSADAYRTKIYPAVPVGFRRIPGTFNLSEDKCRLDFTIADEQMPPNAPPPYVVEVSASHEVSSTNSFYLKWTGQISATYEIVYGQPRALAYGYFADLVRSRTGELMARAQQGAATGVPSGVASIMITHIRMSEPEIYGRQSASFTATYAYILNTLDVLSAGGLFNPVPNYGGFSRWKQSMQQAGIFNERGVAQMGFKTSDDVIIDLCQPSEVPLSPQLGVQNPLANTGLGSIWSNPMPGPNGSWLRYESSLIVEQEDSTIELKTLPTVQVTPIQLRAAGIGLPSTGVGLPAANSNNGLSTVAFGGAGGGGRFTSQQATGPQMYSTTLYQSIASAAQNVAQIRSVPSIVVRLVGRALRAGYPIPQPMLVSIGSSLAIPANRFELGNHFRHALVGNWFGVPIVGASWNLRFIVPAIPLTNLPIPPNPLV